MAGDGEKKVGFSMGRSKSTVRLPAIPGRTSPIPGTSTDDGETDGRKKSLMSLATLGRSMSLVRLPKGAADDEEADGPRGKRLSLATLGRSVSLFSLPKSSADDDAEEDGVARGRSFR